MVEYNHLAYIPEEQFETFFEAIKYRTPEYVRLQNEFEKRFSEAKQTKIVSLGGDELVFGPVEPSRGNTGDYSLSENKGGTIPL